MKSGVYVCAREVVPVSFEVASLPGAGLRDIRYIHSKTEAIRQCEETLARECPDAGFVYEPSTAAGAERIRHMAYGGDTSAWERAALVTESARRLYELDVLLDKAEDTKGKETWFSIIRRV